jgi:hypothetical protein
MAKPEKKSSSSRPPRSPRAPSLTAQTADKHVLYEASVQDTDTDITFINRIYKKAYKRLPVSLREDFCGTAKLCADWAASAAQRTAIGLDLHRPTMQWGKRNHLAQLPAEVQQRVQLQQGNVLDGVASPVDVAVAFNFSYCVFKTRGDLLRYCTRVRHDLTDDGMFFMDIHGGTEVFEEMEETTAHKGFTYVWDQAPYDAITGFAKRYIHFRFPDGTEMHRAFAYDWRLWHLPELCEVLQDAGFSQVDVYWEGADAQGAGDGKFKKTRRAENELSWIAYVVATR